MPETVQKEDIPEPEEVKEEMETDREGSTMIKKVKCKGFKSFARETAVPFYEGMTAIVGENGNGKCVTGDTKVLKADGSAVKIGSLVEKKMENSNTEKIEDGEVSYSPGVKVQSLNPETLEVEEREVTACAKREAPEKLRRIETHSGRRIQATEDHPVFKLREGEVRAVDTGEVSEGDRIAVPRRLAGNTDSKIFTELLDLIEKEDKIYVPHREQFENLLYGLKTKEDATWKELSESIGVSENTLHGIRDGQSCNFASMVKILRYSGMEDEEIIQQLETVEAKNYSKSCKLPWRNSRGFARMMGYLLAEGRVAEDSAQLWFTNSSEKIIEDYSAQAEKFLGLRPEVKDYSENCSDAIIFRQTASTIVEKFGIQQGGSDAKDIPEFFLRHSDEEELKGLLEGLWAGDGEVNHIHFSLTTKSRKLAEKVQRALLRLGVRPRIKIREKIATNSDHTGSNYFEVRVSGARDAGILASKLEIPHDQKQKKLERLARKDSNPNLDVIGATGLVQDIVEKQELSVTALKHEHSKIGAYHYEQCTPSREGLQELMEKIFNHGERTEEVEQLEKLVNSDIYWDEIETVETFETEEEWVYDLNVAVNHNFVAENTFVHNSNIIDGVSFVFGRRSSKLRAKKLGQLIFNGGDSGNPADYAKVTVTLDNSSGVFDEFLEEDEEADEIKVGRKVTQAGSSMYKFQGTNCKASKIDNICEKANIDPEGYHFVRQGKVTEIVEQSPVSRRKVIDELSGVKAYDDKKEAAEEELEEVEHRLQEQQILLEEKKDLVESLKEEKEQALKYRELEQRKEKLQASKLEVRKRALANQIANLNTGVGDKEERLEEVDEKLEEIDDEIDEKEERIDEIEESMGGNSDVEHLETRIEKKKGKIENKREKVEDLEEQIEELENMQSRKNTGSRAVDAVLNLDDDRIKGAFQDLISVDERYAVAIDTAAGSRMKNVVCENKEAATDAINYLKRENIGRATMLPMDKIKDKTRSAKSKMAKKKKGVIGYAADLVEYDSRYEKAVNYVFSDTLVAEDLESVREVNGVRVVTLDGDIMSRGGAMTGGKSKKSRGSSKKLKSSLDPDKKREEKEEVKEEIEELQKDVAELKQMKRRKEEEEGGSDEELREEKKEIREELKDLREERQELYSEQQKLKTKIEDERGKKPKLKAELENVKSDLEEHDFDEEELKLDQSPEDLKDERKRLTRKQNQMGPVNMRAIEEYKEKKEELDEFQEKVSEIRQEKLEIEDMIEDIDRKRRECFMETLEEIKGSFEEIFTQLFDGGDGSLVLEDDSIDGGLEIRAQPPGKEPHIIDALSGGEKTMTAIAFVFAILEYEEAPFYLMDEIDAALDKTNSKKLSELLKDYAEDSQFIVISHNDITVRHAERAYGVSMRDGVSKIRSIELEA